MPINKFTTLLDLARQAKIISGETATFDGKIEVGIPFSGYPTGVDTGTTVSLGVVSSEDAVFSGNTGTTIFDVSNTGSTNYDAIFSGYSATTWSNPLFSGNTSGLTLPITPLSASTQIVGPFWYLTQTGMTGDYVIGTQYTGYSITYSFFDVSQFGTGFTYSGFTTATQENFSAGTLDYKGPLDYISSVEDATIDGRLTTNKLTVTGGASVGTLGYVLTQTGNTGEVGWVYNSPTSGTTGGYWLSGSSGVNSIRVTNGGTTDATGNYALAQNLNTLASGAFSHSEGLGTIASGTSSHSEGRDTIAGGQNSHAQGLFTIASGTESHAGGENSEAEGATSFVHSSNSKVTGNRSAILGGQNITGTTDDTVYVPNLDVSGDINITNTSANLFSDLGVTTPSDNRLTLSGNTLLLTEYNVQSPSVGGFSFGIRGISEPTFDTYGKVGDAYIYSSVVNNGINIISQRTSPQTTDDYIRFYAGEGADSGTTAQLHIQGSGTTRGNIGINNESPTSKLDIIGDTGYQQLRLRTSYTPTSTADTNGEIGDVAWDDDYIYIKTSIGWRRSTLASF